MSLSPRRTGPAYHALARTNRKKDVGSLTDAATTAAMVLLACAANPGECPWREKDMKAKQTILSTALAVTFGIAASAKSPLVEQTSTSTSSPCARAWRCAVRHEEAHR